MVKSGLNDIWRGVETVGLSVWLATEDMRARYNRTALGPMWNVISNVVFVGAMAITFGALFRQPMATFLPYIAASIACWNFISTVLSDGPFTLLRGATIISSYPLPLSTQVFRLVSDKFFMLGHFLAVYLCLAVILKMKIDLVAVLFFVPAMLTYLVAATGATLGLSVLGARYRDLAPAIGSVLTLFFLVTPVFWQKGTLTAANRWIVDFNPFFHLLEIGRRPLLGETASVLSWSVSIGVAILLLVWGTSTFVAMRRQIYYWIG